MGVCGEEEGAAEKTTDSSRACGPPSYGYGIEERGRRPALIREARSLARLVTSKNPCPSALARAAVPREEMALLPLSLSLSLYLSLSQRVHL